ncbi:MAG TPA: hypothetical protein VFA52_02255 [Candidatus Paceibacterota bacterium]|nr:hypothetical protein [Candidatus Paceibacterota bacterium]
MIFLISIFSLSFLVLVAMIGFKVVEIQTGKKYLFFSQRGDQLVREGHHSLRNFFRYWNLRALRMIYHFVLEKLEEFFLGLYRRLRGKLTKPVKMVKGEGSLPEDKSSTSFYLKNIQEHKENNRPEDINLPE